METLWGIELELVPTGPLTFRQMPSGILHIMSYPFMPPTTMSGFLKRLLLLAEGGEWAGYGEDWFQKKGPGKEFTLTLEQEYRALGAFPPVNQWHIHKTRRHGPKNFKHREFSQILRTSHKEHYQLHHWDYLFCEKLTGWVVAKEARLVERLLKLTNYGGKAGKEGWVFVRRVSEPRQLSLQTGEFTPLGLVIPPLRPVSGRFYNVYGHYWDASYEWTNGERGGVVGFTQLGAWWGAERVHGEYWAWNENSGIAAHVPDAFLSGDREPFFQSES